MRRFVPLFILAAIAACAVYAQTTGGRVGKVERFNPAQFSQNQEVVGIGSGASFTNLVLVTPVITFTNGSVPIFTNAYDSSQFTYDTILHIKSGAKTTNENLTTPTMTGGYWTNGTGSGLSLTNTSFYGTVTGLTTNTFDANQFTLTSGTNVHISSGALLTNTFLSTPTSDTASLTNTIAYSTLVFPSSSVHQLLGASSTILTDAVKVRVAGASGAVTLTSTPTIAAGSDGQIVYLCGQDDTKTVTVQDKGTLVGSGLHLAATTRVLGKDDCLTLMYDSGHSVWCEVSFANNL